MKKTICANGVRIVHEKMPYTRSVAIGIWVKAGSLDENKAEWGLSHFIEHMLFKGTTNRSAKAIAEQFDRIGGDINAYTSKEMTCFYTTVLDYHAEKAMEILVDMFFHSVFDETEIEKEKSVILDEIASVEDTPDDDVDERLWSVMYPNHPIGRSIGGVKDTLGKFNRKMIDDYMSRLYTPENIVISIAGNYDEKLVDFIESKFGAFSGNAKGIDSISDVQPIFKSGLTTKHKEIEQAHICIGYPGLALNEKRLHDLILLDSIVGGTMSSRLFQEIREEQGLAYSVFSYYSSYTMAGSFVIYGGTSPEQLENMVVTMDRITAQIKSEGVTELELSNAKEQLKATILLGLESTESRMHRNGKNELVLNEHKGIDEVQSIIDSVKITDVNQIAYETFTDKRAISIIAPKSAALPF
ncbi:pitrilysin family protein [Sporosarcina thermotolerans]|uniref:Pitrilysin family protein n=1 Tax=Sporosarcina thermotolerans TaxID=633404 RepID=A0AAW9A4M8_9BACL|nr:pitrilysin family protein [Sporosarcina thermotolerans]MDW0115685.1 pitrilysin family protein [Sporosarcina thermotolerans]WHT47045.1 pitrilysin family protein [Sporosarcina thermotolerans]